MATGSEHPPVLIVDENDNPIGAKPHDDAMLDEDIRRVVRMFLVNSEGKTLLTKRAPDIKYPGLLDCAAAGHVDEGEDYMEAALRELEEEIGIACSSDDLEEFDYSFYSGQVVFKGKEVTYKSWIKTYTLVSDEEPRPNPDEVAAMEWMTLEEFHDRIAADPKSFMSDVVKVSDKFLASRGYR